MIGINHMKAIYVIVYHYFNEAKQEKDSKIHSAYNSYVEALEQVEMFEQLGGYDGWFEIKYVDYDTNQIY